MAKRIEKRGKFVVFEGVGGSGKSTQISLAEKYVRQDLGWSVVVTREPGGVEAAELIREFIFELRGRELITPGQQVALFFAARKVWLDQLVVPILDSGKAVITDRSYPSTNAYQGYAEGTDRSRIEEMVDVVMVEYKPDGIILLDISAEVAVRRNAVKNERDPYDEQILQYSERVVNGYRRMAKKGWSGVPWYVIDAGQSVEKVARDVRGVLDQIFSVK